MYSVELYARVRRACHIDRMSKREAARVFGIDRKTMDKMLAHSVPPGYRSSQPPSRTKLDPFTSIIERILEADRQIHHKQRHTAKRIFERLRDEHGFTGATRSSGTTCGNAGLTEARSPATDQLAQATLHRSAVGRGQKCR